MKQNIDSFIDSHIDEMITDLQKLIKIPSYNQPAKENMPYGENVALCLDTFLKMAKLMGFKTNNFDNYVGTIELGENPELGILCHLDVVPEGTGWTNDPFSAIVEDGKIFGRGAIDDKGPAIAVLYAMKAIKELNIPLKNGVRFIVGCDEECGSSDLEYYKTKEKFPPMVFTPDGSYPIINIEKGQCRVCFGADFEKNENSKRIISINGGQTVNAVPTNSNAVICGIDLDVIKSTISQLNLDAKFEIKEKENCTVIEVIGKGAHASTPDLGINAVTAIIKLLSNLPFDASKDFEYIKSLDKILPHGDVKGNNINVSCKDEKSGELSLAFSIFNFNEVGFEGHMDIRFPTCTSFNQLKNILNNSFSDVNINIKEIYGVEPHQTSEDSEFVQKLLKVYEEQTGLKGECLAIGGGTYVHDIEGGVAFGAEFPNQEHNMHGADEFIEIDTLIKNSKIFAHSIVELLG